LLVLHLILVITLKIHLGQRIVESTISLLQ